MIAVASYDDKITVVLDATVVADVRRVVGAAVETDAAAVERALDAYLLGRLMDTTQARSDTATGEAERIAYDEGHAPPPEDRGAATHDPTETPAVESASELVRARRERNAPRREAVLLHVSSLRRLAERMRAAAP